MEADREFAFPEFRNDFTKDENGYTVLVPLQDLSLSKTLLPPAIRAAKQHDGKIILLYILEVPYQLPPSEAEQFILEREYLLQYALQIIETAGCDGEIMVRIAHRYTYAIELIASEMGIDLIIMWAKKKGLLWDKKIVNKLYEISSNLIVANQKVESHFNEVILEVDDLLSTSSMLEYATYLLGSGKGIIHVIPNFSEKVPQVELNRLSSIVDAFQRHTPVRDLIIKQYQQESVTNKYLKDICDEKRGRICVLGSYYLGKKSNIADWLKEEAEALDLPVYYSKLGQKEPVGIHRIAHRVKKWLGIIPDSSL